MAGWLAGCGLVGCELARVSRDPELPRNSDYPAPARRPTRRTRTRTIYNQNQGMRYIYMVPRHRDILPAFSALEYPRTRDGKRQQARSKQARDIAAGEAEGGMEIQMQMQVQVQIT